VSKNKHISYPEKERDGEIKRLKDALKRKEKEIEKLKSELRTYEAAFQKNIQFLKGKTKDLSLQELLDGAKKEQNLKQIEGTVEIKFKELEEKWKCHKCGIGIMIDQTVNGIYVNVINRSARIEQMQSHFTIKLKGLNKKWQIKNQRSRI
jgi:uncharacterized FlaG/YvyC family protein